MKKVLRSELCEPGSAVSEWVSSIVQYTPGLHIPYIEPDNLDHLVYPEELGNYETIVQFEDRSVHIYFHRNEIPKEVFLQL